MSDKLRILARLERGPVSPIDFQAPTCDGLKPCIRVAARIKNLRDDGYTIHTSRAANGVAIYTLEAKPENGNAPCPTGTPETAPASVAPPVERTVSAVSTAVAVPPSCDLDAAPLDSSLFNGDDFYESTPHWAAA